MDEKLDYVWSAIQYEFRDRPTVDICEACIYPTGFGEGAYMATAFALLYSVAVPAFVAYGDCSVDPEFLDILRVMPAEGVGKRKNETAMAGFITDCAGNVQ